MTKNLSPEHIKIGSASLRVSRKLRALPNVVYETHPTLARLLVAQAAELRRSFRPARKVRPRTEGRRAA